VQTSRKLGEIPLKKNLATRRGLQVDKDPKAVSVLFGTHWAFSGVVNKLVYWAPQLVTPLPMSREVTGMREGSSTSKAFKRLQGFFYCLFLYKLSMCHHVCTCVLSSNACGLPRCLPQRCFHLFASGLLLFPFGWCLHMCAGGKLTFLVQGCFPFSLRVIHYLIVLVVELDDFQLIFFILEVLHGWWVLCGTVLTRS